MSLSRKQVRELVWFEDNLRSLEDLMPHDRFDELRVYVDRYAGYSDQLDRCPKGIVHGDLFKDNVFFQDNGKLSGVIDFYHACTDTFLFDIAVATNDWCFDGDAFDAARVKSLISAYREVREWNAEEQRAFACALELAGLRFWTSRLATRYLQSYQQDAAIGIASKDPEGMFKVLKAQKKLMASIFL